MKGGGCKCSNGISRLLFQRRTLLGLAFEEWSGLVVLDVRAVPVWWVEQDWWDGYFGKIWGSGRVWMVEIAWIIWIVLIVWIVLTFQTTGFSSWAWTEKPWKA